MFDSIYMKYPEEAEARQKADQQLTGAGRRREQGVTTKRHRVFLWGDKNVLELNRGYSCATL